MAWNYSYQKEWDKHTMAKAAGTWMPISPKMSREVCAYVKGKKAVSAINDLKRVINKKLAIPYKRYNTDQAHRKGMGPGGYPVKTCEHIIKVIKSVIANAENKGLDPNHLEIIHAVTHRALSKERRRGRYSHVEIIVKEKGIIPQKPKKKEKKPKKKKKEKPKKKKKDEKKKGEKKKEEKKKEKKRKKKEGGVDYSSMTKAEVYEKAQELDVSGRSTMNKKELIKAVKKAEEKK